MIVFLFVIHIKLSHYHTRDLLLDGNLNLNTGCDADGGDLLGNLRGRAQVHNALVDAHLKAIPGLGTLTARGLAGGDAKKLQGGRYM